MLPGVLSDDLCFEEESHFAGLLEYPQYTRPNEWHGKEIPKELLSGNKKDISSWRLEQALERTKTYRPDLFAQYEDRMHLRSVLLKKKRSTAHLLDRILSPSVNVLFSEELTQDAVNLVLCDTRTNQFYVHVAKEGDEEKLMAYLPSDVTCIIVSGLFHEAYYSILLD